MDWMVYGATGFTGKKIIGRAVELGLRPVVAGRSVAKVRKLGETYHLPTRSFDASTPDLRGMGLVLNCAGPFSSTAEPIYDTCLKLGIHYLDITGEISVFENIYRRHTEAVRAGSVIIPGVGFDVVPTDCLSVLLHRKLPDATHLEIAIDAPGPVSPGTVKTMVENLPHGTKERRHGEIVNLPHAASYKRIAFKNHSRWAVSIPWGDIASAYRSTGIANIKVYFGVPRKMILGMIALRPLFPILSLTVIQRALVRYIEKNIPGGTSEQMKKNNISIWGIVKNSSKQSEELTWELRDPYLFTVESALRAVEKVRAGAIRPGCWTPGLAFGPEFLDEVLTHL
jgi:short subunit dehydrogenase-like uncharacterized protein